MINQNVISIFPLTVLCLPFQARPATNAESQDLTGPSVSEDPDWADISSDEETLEASFQVENEDRVSRSTQVSRKPRRRSKGKS